MIGKNNITHLKIGLFLVGTLELLIITNIEYKVIEIAPILQMLSEIFGITNNTELVTNFFIFIGLTNILLSISLIDKLIIPQIYIPVLGYNIICSLIIIKLVNGEIGIIITTILFTFVLLMDTNQQIIYIINAVKELNGFPLATLITKINEQPQTRTREEVNNLINMEIFNYNENIRKNNEQNKISFAQEILIFCQNHPMLIISGLSILTVGIIFYQYNNDISQVFNSLKNYVIKQQELSKNINEALSDLSSFKMNQKEINNENINVLNNLTKQVTEMKSHMSDVLNLNGFILDLPIFDYSFLLFVTTINISIINKQLKNWIINFFNYLKKAKKNIMLFSMLKIITKNGVTGFTPGDEDEDPRKPDLTPTKSHYEEKITTNDWTTEIKEKLEKI